MEHFLLICPCFDVNRQGLLAGRYSVLRPLGYVDFANGLLLLLFQGDGDEDLTLNFMESCSGHIGYLCCVERFSDR